MATQSNLELTLPIFRRTLVLSLKMGFNMSYLERAISDGHAKLTGEGKQQKILYVAVNHTERYADPEEQVRAEFWAELIYRYGYEPARIGVEITVPDRTPSDRADLVVFRDDERKKPYAVIEYKQDGVTDAEFNQAVEQACGNGTWAKFRANYVGVVAGMTRRFFDFSEKYGVLEREANIIADLPRQYGKPEEYRFYKGDPNNDIQPVSKEALIGAIKKCHQTLWAGGKLSPPAAFGELCKIIFVKISDEQAKRKKGEPYEFQIKTHEPSRRLAERIKSLYETQKQKDPDVFTETVKIDDASLRTVVSHLESINLSKTDLDTKGLAFEQFMDGFFKGDFGQYFTPREIISFAVEMTQPQSEHIVLDPACGSGGFLLYAMDAVRHDADKEFPNHEADPNEAIAHKARWHDFAKDRLFGIEINDEIARVAKMNMIIHDDGHTNVIGADSLDRVERMYAVNRGFAKNRFDLVLTNPPFGAQVVLAERPYLADYELGNAEDSKGNKKARKNQKTEILFLERVWHFLKPKSGRAAVVLPDGILTNSSLQYVRDFLLEHFQVQAVISLPPTAFSHYGAGVKSSLVFLRKRAEDEKPDDNEAIFMAVPELIGYDATGRKCDNQLPEVTQQFRKFQKDAKPFFV
jgi:type I restriction enzyme M protein